MSIPLPPTGIHPEEFVFMNDAQLRARDQEIVRCVLEAATKACGHLAQADAVAAIIYALEFHHE